MTMAKPRPRPQPRRPNPASASGPVTEPPDTVVDVAELARQNAALSERLEQLEAGRVRYAEPTPEYKAEPRVARTESLPPFLQDLLKDTHAPVQPEPEPSYNAPERLYLKHDGTVQWLQGDSRARAYYADKGYRVLSKQEAEYYLAAERPKVLAEQRRRAHLVGSLRKLIDREPQLMGYIGDNDWDNSLSDMTTAELEDEWTRLVGYSVHPTQSLPRAPRFRDSAPESVDALAAGVETGTNRSDFLRRVQNGHSAG